MSTAALDMPADPARRRPIATVAEQRTLAQEQRSVWQREMERAATEAWFRHPAVPLTSSAATRVQATAPTCMAADATTSRRPARVADESVAGARPSSVVASTSASETRGGSRFTDDAAQASSTGPAQAGPTAHDDGGPNDMTCAATRRVVDAGHRAAAVPTGATPSSVVEVAGSQGSSVVPTSGVTPSGSAMAVTTQPWATEFRGVVAVTAEASTAEPLPSAPLSVAQDGSAELGESAPLRRALQAATSSAAPLRMHVEWNDGVATVWIGLDRAAETTLPGLIASVSETFARHGLRLRSVVCNGSRRFDAAAITTGVGPGAKPVDVFFESEL